MGGLKTVHVELTEANAFVEKFHRHHEPVTGHRFSIGATKDGKLVGVAIVGRPVARMTDQKNTLEVVRLCTDGTPNTCSFLYAKAAQVGKLLGYQSIQTFILENETGTTLIAAGWKKVGETGGGDWNRPSRAGRRTNQPMCPKSKWVCVLAE